MQNHFAVMNPGSAEQALEQLKELAKLKQLQSTQLSAFNLPPMHQSTITESAPISQNLMHGIQDARSLGNAQLTAGMMDILKTFGNNVNPSHSPAAPHNIGQQLASNNQILQACVHALSTSQGGVPRGQISPQLDASQIPAMCNSEVAKTAIFSNNLPPHLALDTDASGLSNWAASILAASAQQSTGTLHNSLPSALLSAGPSHRAAMPAAFPGLGATCSCNCAADLALHTRALRDMGRENLALRARLSQLESVIRDIGLDASASAQPRPDDAGAPRHPAPSRAPDAAVSSPTASNSSKSLLSSLLSVASSHSAATATTTASTPAHGPGRADSPSTPGSQASGGEEEGDEGGGVEAASPRAAGSRPKMGSRFWSKAEHARFLDALRRRGTFDAHDIARVVGTRTVKQVRSHAQKYFLKLARTNPQEDEHRARAAAAAASASSGSNSSGPQPSEGP